MTRYRVLRERTIVEQHIVEIDPPPDEWAESELDAYLLDMTDEASLDVLEELESEIRLDEIEEVDD